LYAKTASGFARAERGKIRGPVRSATSSLSPSVPAASLFTHCALIFAPPSTRCGGIAALMLIPTALFPSPCRKSPLMSVQRH